MINRAAYDSDEDEAFELDDKPIVNVLTCGWMEDGRCGYAPNPSHIQKCLRPVTGLSMEPDHYGKIFVCRDVAAGNRHTSMLLINCQKEPGRGSKKTKKIAYVGLNQRGLCEEPGNTSVTDFIWDLHESPVSISAGFGTTFVVTKHGNVFSCGNGRYGVLGHGDSTSHEIPQQVMGLLKQKIRCVAVGSNHAIGLTTAGRLWAWGRNNKGQLGLLNYERKEDFVPPPVTDMQVYPPEHITYFHKHDTALQVACGYEHTMALVRVVNKNHTTKQVVYVWGDDSHGQLGSSDSRYQHHPQENRWLTQLCNALQISNIAQIACGGHHCMILSGHAGQVISWGAGDYGQLGHGFAWDDRRPRLISSLKDVIQISAGARHSMALKSGNPNEIYSWGYNAYGECGLGDTDMRLQPTMITGLGRARPIAISCGDRHSVVVTSHKPLRATEEPSLRQYFAVLNEGIPTVALKRQLKQEMNSHGLDGNVLDHPETVLPDQPGSTPKEIINEKYERGLRYCLDSKCDPSDWRRKTYETCYQCPSLNLRSVCLSCARHCLFDQKLIPYIRLRKPTFYNSLPDHLREQRETQKLDENSILDINSCDCITTGRCQCSWSSVRDMFDKYSAIEDQCIGPNQVRALLQALRSPAPVDNADVEECLMTIADGKEDDTEPRIKPVPFERWYREFYQEYADDRWYIVLQLKAAKKLKSTR